jgi:hypothetical protein
MSWSLIGSLLFGCRPAAIFWAVGTVVVDAVNTVLRTWLRPHVSKKVCKTIPSFADGNPASPVVPPLGSSRIMASLPHRFPRSIFRRPVRTMRPPAAVELSTSARRVPSALSIDHDAVGSFLSQAVAQHAPKLPYLLARANVTDEPHGNKIAERLVCDVLKASVRLTSFGLSHGVNLLERSRCGQSRMDVRASVRLALF